MNSYGIGLVVLVSLACAAFGGCDRAVAADRSNTRGQAQQQSHDANQRSGVANNGRGQVRRPLDLTLPAGVHAPRGLKGERSDAVDPFSLNLFTETKKQTPLNIRGRLLMNDEGDLSVEALDGAEIIIVVPTR